MLGHMLVDLVESKPNDLAHAIRTFVNCTAMLRECSFCHIGAMLVRLLNADAPAGADDAAAILALSPSTVTEQQASAIGSAIALSVHRSESQAAALRQAVDLDPVLHTTKSQHLWFVPMLEVLLVPPETAEPRRPSIARRLSAIVTPQATFYAPSSAGFDSVVRFIPSIPSNDDRRPPMKSARCRSVCRRLCRPPPVPSRARRRRRHPHLVRMLLPKRSTGQAVSRQVRTSARWCAPSPHPAQRLFLYAKPMAT